MIVKYRIILILCMVVVCSFITHAYPDLKVFPKIITPGTPPSNGKVYFDFTVQNDQRPKLIIMNLVGEKIIEISTLNPQAIPSGWRLFWDGKDENGRLVMPGVYLYQWEESLKSRTGAIVVAR
jgi:hypothetical protein